ncbi:MAG: symmetrical bis(5'-nucleosyl)-tetraphosphatase [Pseudomonadales bacterium]|jgi:bis(5'-nucleosyl)-tetraphosphatase (symmetrical)
MATYAIGDIQGCFKALNCVLEKAEFDPARDNLWVAGDLVNRGPDSLSTLRYIKGLGDNAKVVLGNHDLHMLAVAYGIKRPHRSDTLDEVFAAEDADELFTWLRQQPLLYYCPERNYALVHAGLAPQWDIEQALSLSREVETALQGPDFKDFLLHMYGDEPDHWSDDLQGWPRLRVITNHLTRMRLCDGDDHLDLHHKHDLSDVREGFRPWFSHTHRKTRHINILFGHWAALEGESNENHVFALDTGCVWGGRLTMMRLEDHRLFSCSCDTVK